MNTDRSPQTYFSKSYLLDGPIMLAPARKTAMAINMGAELLEQDAYRDRQDAMRCLLNSKTGWSSADVVILLDNAMQVAAQAAVAAEMSDPQ